MVLDITPVPKPRMTQRDRWARRPAVSRYRDYKDELWRFGVRALPEALGVIFTLPMPQSWSNRKRTRHAGSPHKSRPDLDNLIKGLLDAILEEDSGIHRMTARKIWGATGSLTIWDLEADEHELQG